MATQSPTVLLDHYLKQLKLPTMLREYHSVAGVCAREGQDHIAYLLRLSERETDRARNNVPLNAGSRPPSFPS